MLPLRSGMLTEGKDDELKNVALFPPFRFIAMNRAQPTSDKD